MGLKTIPGFREISKAGRDSRRRQLDPYSRVEAVGRPFGRSREEPAGDRCIIECAGKTLGGNYRIAAAAPLEARKGGKEATDAERIGEEVAKRSADRYAGRRVLGQKRGAVRVRKDARSNRGERLDTEPEAARRRD